MIEGESASHAEEKSEKETGRVEAFSDGVFAIAITLLALDLKVPEVKSLTPLALAQALWAKWPSYVIFLISFATILIMWVYHHRLFQSLKRADTWLLFSNGFLLLLITAVPFPTALAGTYLTTPAAPVACATYAGFFVLINLSYNLLWWMVLRQQTGYHWRRTTLNWSIVCTLLGLPCYLLATAVAFWHPLLSIIICALLWLVWAITAPAQRIEQMNPLS